MIKKSSTLIFVLASALFLGACGASDTTSGNEPSDESSVGASAAEERTASEASSVGAVGEEVSASGGTFTRVSPEELQGAIKSEDLVIVNTHIPYAGDLPGTDLSIPYTEISDNLDKLPGKDERIVLYCRTGAMSNEAARTLVELGYTNVWDLGGGMEAWQGAGFELVGV